MRLSPKQTEALRILAEGKFFPCLVKESDGWHARWRAIATDNGWIDEYVRRASITRLTEDAEEQKHETLHDAWMMALRSRTGLVKWDDEECDAFAAELREWAGSADEDVAARATIAFTLKASGDKFMVECAAPKDRRRLRALGQAAYVWPPLLGLRRDRANPERLVVDLRRGDAENFATSGARALSGAGYGTAGLPQKAEVSASAECMDDATCQEPKLNAGSMKLTVRVAGEQVTAGEIRFLLDQGSTLVFFRDRWIEVDRGILKVALRALEKGCGGKANLVSFAMGIGCVGGLEIEELKAGGWLRGLVAKLRNRGESIGKLSVPGLSGKLRDYQEEGVAWMKFLSDNGFGALLADDMGLGKTVQTIAWLLASRHERMGASLSPALIVAPLSLLSNWRHEFARFAPSLSVYVHHGDSRHVASGFVRAANGSDVVLTSYNLLARDYAMFSEVRWDALVVDEAQAAKNSETQISKAIRALMPSRRIALTGTPVENSLTDIWALEDFLNPGFLGNLKSFRERFVKPIASNANATAARRLRRALEPFVLRRLKSDPMIAAELGEKREIREYCELDAASRAEYEMALADFRANKHSQGDALALLTRLKLVCDGMHGDAAGQRIFPESGKLLRLCDMLEQIFANGESALVFTQYAKAGLALQTELEKRFGRYFPFLHGALSAKAREREIAKFNAGFGKGASDSPSAFILSLKAGGFGLNLTKATHVIHFDRWWNPAVEAQATDRAHRIGQTAPVFVHLMITSGTIEERVDEILMKKGSLASLLADGDAFWKAVSLAPDEQERRR